MRSLPFLAHAVRCGTGNELMTSPLVSVIMPVYNDARYVMDAVNSVLGQSLRDLELIAIDDGSTDETPAVLRSVGDDRFRLITQPVNQGSAAARNRGIEAARGRYVALLDADDRAYPRRLERQVAFMEGSPHLALIGSWSRIVDEGGQPLGRVKRHPIAPDEVRARLLFRCCISQRGVMARREAFEVCKYDPEFRLSQDFDLFVRMAKSLKLGNMPEILMEARMHGKQITRTKRQAAKLSNIEIIRRQIEDLKVPYVNSDLERHFFLTRPKLLEADLDVSYLGWAANWIAGLQRANRKQCLYNPDSLRSTCGEIWFDLCRRAAQQHGWTMWRSFARAPFFLPGLTAFCRKKLHRPTARV